MTASEPASETARAFHAVAAGRQERERIRRAQAEAVREIELRAYAQKRQAQIDDLIADPYSWRYIAVQASAFAESFPVGDHRRSTLVRLFAVASDLADLGDDLTDLRAGRSTT